MSDRRKYPLRKVVGEWQNQHGLQMELLECGHSQPRKEDIYGPTNAYSRRCHRCAKSEAEAQKAFLMECGSKCSLMAKAVAAARAEAFEEAAKIVESAVAPPGVLGTVLIQSDELAARIRSRAKDGGQ